MRGVVGSFIHGGRGVIEQYSVRARPRHLGGPRHDHEVGPAAGHKQWIIGQQRNEDRAVAALGGEVKAVVEELAEEGEPRIERRRQAYVRGDVGDEVGQAVVVRAEHAIHPGACDDLGTGRKGGRDCRRVVGGLVGDQVRDRARRGIEYRARRLQIRACDGGCIGRAIRIEAGAVGIEGNRLEHRCRHAREHRIGCAELVLAHHQMIERSVHRSQAEGHKRIWNQFGQ